MKRIALVLILGFVIACGGKKETEEFNWPAEPTDGTPVVIVSESVGPDKKGKDLEATVRVFNFTDKDVTRISMTLDYLDGTGKKLKDFPWGMSGMPRLVGPRGMKLDTVGAFLPPETKKVAARIRNVEFKDGTKWENPKKE